MPIFPQQSNEGLVQPPVVTPSEAPAAIPAIQAPPPIAKPVQQSQSSTATRTIAVLSPYVGPDNDKVFVYPGAEDRFRNDPAYQGYKPTGLWTVDDERIFVPADKEAKFLSKNQGKRVERLHVVDDNGEKIAIPESKREKFLSERYPSVTPPAVVTQPVETSSTGRRIFGDTGVSLAKSAIGVGEAAVGLLDIPTMGYAGKAYEWMGGDFKATKAAFDSLLSPEQKAVNAEVAKAVGFLDSVKAYVSNPSAIFHSGVESSLSMLGGAGIARKAVSIFPKLKPLVAAAITEGAVTAGQNIEQVRQDTPGGTLSPQQVGVGVVSGAATALLGIVGGKLAKELGFDDVDVLLMGFNKQHIVSQKDILRKQKSILRRAIEAAISEGAFEELPQSLQEQVAMNLSLGRPAGEGVAEAGAQGMLVGAAMGAGAQIPGAISDYREKRRMPPPATKPEAKTGPTRIPWSPAPAEAPVEAAQDDGTPEGINPKAWNAVPETVKGKLVDMLDSGFSPVIVQRTIERWVEANAKDAQDAQQGTPAPAAAETTPTPEPAEPAPEQVAKNLLTTDLADTIIAGEDPLDPSYGATAVARKILDDALSTLPTEEVGAQPSGTEGTGRPGEGVGVGPGVQGTPAAGAGVQGQGTAEAKPVKSRLPKDEILRKVDAIVASEKGHEANLYLSRISSWISGGMKGNRPEYGALPRYGKGKRKEIPESLATKSQQIFNLYAGREAEPVKTSPPPVADATPLVPARLPKKAPVSAAEKPVLTTRLNNGYEVTAKNYEGKPSAITYANRKQALAALARLPTDEGWDVYTFAGRAFYVAKKPNSAPSVEGKQAEKQQISPPPVADATPVPPAGAAQGGKAPESAKSDRKNEPSMRLPYSSNPLDHSTEELAKYYKKTYEPYRWNWKQAATDSGSRISSNDRNAIHNLALSELKNAANNDDTGLIELELDQLQRTIKSFADEHPAALSPAAPEAAPTPAETPAATAKPPEPMSSGESDGIKFAIKHGMGLTERVYTLAKASGLDVSGYINKDGHYEMADKPGTDHKLEYAGVWPNYGRTDEKGNVVPDEHMFTSMHKKGEETTLNVPELSLGDIIARRDAKIAAYAEPAAAPKAAAKPAAAIAAPPAPAKARMPKKVSEATTTTEPTKTPTVLYHGTTQSALRKIATEGINPTTMGQVSLSDTEQYAKSYADRKGGARSIVLRVKGSPDFEQDTRITAGGDYLSKKTIPPDQIEVKMPDGSWASLNDVDVSIGTPERKTAKREPWKMTRERAVWGEWAPDGLNTDRALAGRLARWEKIKREAKGVNIEAVEKAIATEKARIERANAHREAVKAALAAGKPVPTAVLADYPELAKKAEPVPAAEPAATPADTIVIKPLIGPSEVVSIAPEAPVTVNPTTDQKVEAVSLLDVPSVPLADTTDTRQRRINNAETRFTSAFSRENLDVIGEYFTNDESGIEDYVRFLKEAVSGKIEGVDFSVPIQRRVTKDMHNTLDKVIEDWDTEQANRRAQEGIDRASALMAVARKSTSPILLTKLQRDELDAWSYDQRVNEDELDRDFSIRRDNKAKEEGQPGYYVLERNIQSEQDKFDEFYDKLANLLAPRLGKQWPTLRDRLEDAHTIREARGIALTEIERYAMQGDDAETVKRLAAQYGVSDTMPEPEPVVEPAKIALPPRVSEAVAPPAAEPPVVAKKTTMPPRAKKVEKPSEAEADFVSTLTRNGVAYDPKDVRYEMRGTYDDEYTFEYRTTSSSPPETSPKYTTREAAIKAAADHSFRSVMPVAEPVKPVGNKADLIAEKSALSQRISDLGARHIELVNAYKAYAKDHDMMTTKRQSRWGRHEEHMKKSVKKADLDAYNALKKQAADIDTQIYPMNQRLYALEKQITKVRIYDVAANEGFNAATRAAAMVEVAYNEGTSAKSAEDALQAAARPMVAELYPDASEAEVTRLLPAFTGAAMSAAKSEKNADLEFLREEAKYRQEMQLGLSRRFAVAEELKKAGLIYATSGDGSFDRGQPIEKNLPESFKKKRTEFLSSKDAPTREQTEEMLDAIQKAVKSSAKAIEKKRVEAEEAAAEKAARQEKFAAETKKTAKMAREAYYSWKPPFLGATHPIEQMASLAPKNSTLDILRNLFVKNGAMWATDIDTEIESKTNLPDGIYRPLSKSLIIPFEDAAGLKDVPSRRTLVVDQTLNLPNGSARHFVEALRSGLRAASTDESRIIITGVALAKSKDGGLLVAAADGRMYSVAAVPVDVSALPDDWNFVMSAEVVSAILRDPHAEEAKLEFGKANDNPYLRFSNGNTTIVGKGLQGSYPLAALLQISTGKPVVTWAINRKALAKAMTAIAKAAKGNKTTVVQIMPKQGELTLRIKRSNEMVFDVTVPATTEEGHAEGEQLGGGFLYYTDGKPNFDNPQVDAEILADMVKSSSDETIYLSPIRTAGDKGKEGGSLSIDSHIIPPKANDTTPEPPKPFSTTLPGDKATDPTSVAQSVIVAANRIAVLGDVLVKDGTLFATDLDMTVAVPTTLKKGMYVGKSLLPDTIEASEFPPITKPAEYAGETAVAKKDAKALLRGIRMAVASASQDETRRVLNGILFQFDKGTLTLVGTDGRRLHMSSVPVTKPVENEKGEFILPTKACEVLLKSNGQGPISIRWGGTQVVFDDGNIELTSKLIDGVFPNYLQVIPKHEKSFDVSRKAFGEALSELTPYLTDKIQSAKLVIANGTMTLQVNNPDLGPAGEYETAIPVSGEKDAELTVTINPFYMDDILRTVGSGSDALRVEYTDGHNPLLLREPQTGKTAVDTGIGVIMPMSLGGPDRTAATAPTGGAIRYAPATTLRSSTATKNGTIVSTRDDADSLIERAKKEFRPTEDVDSSEYLFPDGSGIAVYNDHRVIGTVFNKGVPKGYYKNPGALGSSYMLAFMGETGSARVRRTSSGLNVSFIERPTRAMIRSILQTGAHKAFVDRFDRQYQTLESQQYSLPEEAEELIAFLLGERFSDIRYAPASPSRPSRLPQRASAATLGGDEAARYAQAPEAAYGLPEYAQPASNRSGAAGNSQAVRRGGTSAATAKAGSGLQETADRLLTGDYNERPNYAASEEAVRNGGYDEDGLADYLRANYAPSRPPDGNYPPDRLRAEQEAIAGIRREAAARGGEFDPAKQVRRDDGLGRDPSFQAIAKIAHDLKIVACPVEGVGPRGFSFNDKIFVRNFGVVEATGIHEIGHVLYERGEPSVVALVDGVDLSSDLFKNRVEDTMADPEYKKPFIARAMNDLGPDATEDAILAHVGKQVQVELAMEALEGRPYSMWAYYTGDEAMRLKAAAIRAVLGQPSAAQAPGRTGKGVAYAGAETPAAPATGPPVTAADDSAYMGDDGKDPLPEVSTPEEDKAWLARNPKSAAILQRMVDKAAKRARYNVGPVWHGSEYSFNVFDLARSGQASGVEGAGIFLTDNAREAQFYAKEAADQSDSQEGAQGHVQRAYIRANNPATLTAKETEQDHASAIRAKFSQGHDAVWMQDKNARNVSVRDPSQIKSADAITRDDAGRVIPPAERFKPKSADIRYAPETPPTPKRMPPRLTKEQVEAVRASKTERQKAWLDRHQGQMEATKDIRDTMKAAKKDAGRIPMSTSEALKLAADADHEIRQTGTTLRKISETARAFEDAAREAENKEKSKKDAEAQRRLNRAYAIGQAEGQFVGELAGQKIGRKEGKAIGRAIGLEEGRAKGLKAGILSGGADANREIRENMSDVSPAMKEAKQTGMPKRVSEVVSTLAEDTNHRIRETKATLNKIAGVVAMGEKATAKDIKDAQTAMRNFIRDNMPRQELKRAEWMKLEDAIVKVQSMADLTELAPKVVELADQATHRILSGEIKLLWEKIKGDKSLAVDAVQEVFKVLEPYMSGEKIRLKGPTDKNKAEAQKLKDQAIIQNAMFGGAIKDLTDREINILRSLTVTPLADMGVDALRELRDTMKGWQQMGRFILKARRAVMRSKADAAAEEIAADTTPPAEFDFRKDPNGLSWQDRAHNRWEKMKSQWRWHGYNVSPIASLFASFSKDGTFEAPIIQLFKRPADTATNRWAVENANVITETLAKIRDLGISKDRMSVIGMRAIMQQKNGIKKLLNSGYTDMQLASVPELTPKENEFLAWMRSKMDAIFPDLQRIAKMYYNIDLKKEDAYFPFTTDFEAMQGKTFQEMFSEEGGSIVPIQAPGDTETAKTVHTEQGFMKERTGAGIQAVQTDAARVFLNHMNKALYYREMEPVLQDLSKIIANDGFREAMGTERLVVIKGWLDTLARHGGVPNAFRWRALERLTSYIGAAKLIGKPATILVQATPIILGVPYNGAWQLKSAVEVPASMTLRNWIYANSAAVRFRMGNDQAYNNDAIDGIMREITRVGFYPISKVDRLAATITWWGAYCKRMADAGKVPDITQPADPDAAYYADEIMHKVNASTQGKDMPQVLSRGTLTPGGLRHKSIAKAVFQFQNPLFYMSDIIRRDVSGKLTSAPAFAAFVLLLWLAANAWETEERRAMRMLMQPETWKNRYKYAGAGEKLFRRWAAELDADDPRAMANLLMDFGQQTSGNIPGVMTLQGFASGGQRTGMPVVDTMRDLGAGLYDIASSTDNARKKGVKKVARTVIGSFVPGGTAGLQTYEAVTGEKPLR